MIVLQYDVYDLLSEELIINVLSGIYPTCIKLYALKGTEGLLEDFLTEKQFAFFEPIEVEMPENFNYFTISFSNKIKEIDLAKPISRIILLTQLPQPSMN